MRLLLAGHREMLLEELRGDGLALARGLSDAVDVLIRAWVDACPAGRGLAVLALGGYGRGELSPRSDVDVMVLFPDGTEGRAEELTAPLLTFLWDLGHVVGHSTRSVSGCREAMERDIPSATAMLEARLVTGSRALFRTFVEEVVDPWLGDHAEIFIERKIEEALARHRFYGGSPRILVPNVKESPGGLRDMHVAGWIGLALSGRKDFRVFREAGLVDEAGSGALLLAYSHVHRIRHVLHELSRAKQDVIEPPLRARVAERLGFADSEGFSAGERFMRHYYSAALVLNRFLERVIHHRFVCRVSGERRPVGRGLVAVGEEVHPEGPDDAATPAAALEAVATVLRKGLEPSADLVEAVARAAAAVDDRTRSDPEIARRFLDLLRDDGAGAALRILDRTGFLGEYVPEYGRLAGLAREDPYHRYTVDEHTLRAVENVTALAGKEGRRRDEFRRLARPDLLRLALLLHDVGKASAGDHVERGIALVPEVTARLGLAEEDASLVYFLVHRHLLLTRLADRGVPSEAAAELVRTVPDRGRLRALFLLTLADVAAVDKASLSGWREAQIERLYRDAMARLSGRRPRPLVDRVADAAGPGREEEIREHLAGMGPRYALEVDADRVALHLDLARRVTVSPVALSHLPAEAWSEVWVGARDVPGLFARIAGVLTLHDLDIRAAHVYTREDGLALDGFFVTRDDGSLPPTDDVFWGAVARDLADVVSGKLDLEERLASRRRRFRPEPAATAPIRPVGASASDRISDRYTAIEVVARDRAGLLHDLAHAIAARGLSIHHAIIATRDPEVTDTFYVAFPDHRRPDEATRAALLEDLQGLLRHDISDI